jgi:hypothetical protein
VNIYLVGFDGLVNGFPPEDFRRLARYRNVGALASYFNYRKPGTPLNPNILTIRRLGWKMFLDSGAFSALHTGEKIEPGGYADFIHAHRQHFDVIASLDVMRDPVASEKNFAYLKKRGLGEIVLPVYHYGSERKYLDRALDASGGRVAIGGVARLRPKDALRWLSGTHEYLAKRGCRYVHGFAVTGMQSMAAFPWSSVDSTVIQKAVAHNLFFVGMPPRRLAPSMLLTAPLAVQLEIGRILRGAKTRKIFNAGTRQALWMYSARSFVEYVQRMTVARRKRRP